MMVAIEGRGEVAPSPHKIKMNAFQQRVAVRAAEEIERGRGYSQRTDKWGGGQKPEIVLPSGVVIPPAVRALFCGILGELAVSWWIQKRLPGIDVGVDLETRKAGDGGIDLTILGTKVQVKTRQTRTRETLVQVVNQWGRPVELVANLFVFCEWDCQDYVSLLGWCRRRVLQDLPVVDSPIGNWRNVEVPDHKLLPMSQLIEGLEAIRLGGVA